MKQDKIKEYLLKKGFVRINTDIFYKEKSNSSISVSFEKEFIIFERYFNYVHDKNSFRYENVDTNLLYKNTSFFNYGKKRKVKKVKKESNISLMNNILYNEGLSLLEA